MLTFKFAAVKHRRRIGLAAIKASQRWEMNRNKPVNENAAATANGHLARLKQSALYQSLTSEGRAYIENALVTEPTRFVGANSLMSISGTIASRKVGLTLQYDSGSAERPFILECELREDVWCFIDQPPSISVLAHDRNGKVSPRRKTVDFLVLKQSSAELVECKRLDELRKLRDNYPQDWIEHSGGEWSYVPGDKAAERLGLIHRVFCPDTEYTPAETHNLEIYLLTRTFKWSTSASKTALTISRWLDGGGARTVVEICQNFTKATLGLILSAIKKNILFADLANQFADRDMLVFSSRESWEKSKAFENIVSPISEIGELHARLLRCSPAQFNAAVIAQSKFNERRANGQPLVIPPQNS